MDASLFKELKKFGSVKTNVSLAKFATFRIGGTADIVIEVEERSKFLELLKFLTGEGEEYLVLGGGSNVLLPDGEIHSVVIRNKTKNLKISGKNIYADSGVVFGLLTNTSVGAGLSGLEWSAGLPGTVGGAVRGNAGAAGGETAKVVSEVYAYLDGEEITLKPEECKFGYRDSIFKHNGGVVLGANFLLSEGDKQKSLAKMQEIIDRRRNYYPPYPSAGSFFKNISRDAWSKKNSEIPEKILSAGNIPVGWLSEKVGLKGFRVGGAMVSELHGNFLINYNDATQEDVLKLVETVKSKVYNEFGVSLEEEVQIIH